MVPAATRCPSTSMTGSGPAGVEVRWEISAVGTLTESAPDAFRSWNRTSASSPSRSARNSDRASALDGPQQGRSKNWISRDINGSLLGEDGSADQGAGDVV